MTPKGKQNYVRHITERAREFMESSRKGRRKKKKREENERAGERKGEGGSGVKWKVKKKKKKGEDGILWVYVCGEQNAREKKGNVWMKERQRIRNHNLKYYHNIFTINFK